MISVKKEDETFASVKKPPFRTRQAERNRRARVSWRQRQREAMEYFAEQRRQEQTQPTPVFEAHEGKLTRRVFNASTGRAEELVRTRRQGATSGRRKCSEVSQDFPRDPPTRSSVGTVGVEGISYHSASTWKGGSASQRMQ